MVAAAPVQWIANAVGETAAWFIEALWTVFDQTTLVDVTSGTYISVYNLVFGIGITIALLLFCFQLITAVVKREPGGLTRAEMAQVLDAESTEFLLKPFDATVLLETVRRALRA